MLQNYGEWGASLYEDIQELSLETSHVDYTALEDGVRNYYAMGYLIGAKPTTDNFNFSQLSRTFKDKSKVIGYSDNKVVEVISKLNISDETRELFRKR